MIEFENYKTNLDLKDKLGLKDVDINKAMCYTGDVKLLKEKKKISTEDNKPNQPLAAAIVGLNNTTGTLPSKPEVNAWTEIDAQELLLNSKPTCYLILSKPGAGAYSLGEAMSKKFNCIHLCPKNMITDEIDQQSFTGKCIDFNMKYNKLLMYDTLLKMLKIKLESPVIQHRGYIISGFPLVTASRSPKYMVKSLYSEEAFEIVYDLLFDTIANLKKKKPQLKKSDESLHISVSSEVHGEDYEEEEEEEKVEEEELPEEEQELKVELPHFFLNTCSDIIHPIKPYYNTKKVVLLQQLNYLFSLELKPDIIIYLSCPDKDLLRIKSHTFINYKKNRHVVEPFITYTPSEVRWPVRYTTRDYIAPIDNQKFKSKYWCRQPINFENNAIEEMCNYKHDIFPFIEMKLTEIDPKFVIKLDARLTLHELMSNISERLVMMPVMPVIIPEPLFIEEPPDDLEEFWQSIQELNVIKSNDITFKRSASLWYSRCPVELKKRRSVRGNPKLAVRFLKYIYLIASLDNMISFCRNPRPYLKLKYLEPTCRIIVTGTPLSGKTMIAECLSWLFDTPIINYNDFVQAEIHKKYNTYAKTILSEIIATIEDARFAKWERDDLERIAKLDAWCELAIAALKTYIPLLNEYLRLTALQNQCLCPSLQEDLILVTSKEEIVEREGKKHVKKRKDEIIEEKETPSVEFMNQFNTIRRQLSSLPFLDDPDACNNALSKEIIVQYGPTQLTTPTKKPNLPILGDEDTMEAIKTYIVANELQNEMQPTIEELVSELTTIISSIDEKHQKQTNFDEMYGKYIIDGFPSDPEYWSILAESKLLPDYTVALIEYRETEPILIETYKSIHGHINIHQERYMSANDPLIKTKQKGENLPESDKAFDIKIILHDIIQDVEFPKAEITEANAEIDPWTSYLSDNIEKFKEDWDSIKLRLEESAKSFIDVILENKSDIDVIEEVLLRLRQSYYLPCEVNEDEFNDEEDDTSKDIITYNDPQNFGDTGKYCPITYHNHGVLWSGKPEFSVKFHDKLYRFCNEECLQLFQKDVTKYQSLNKPFKALPPLRICVIGCIGSGKTTISKLIAKELGLMHIDFAEIINNFLMPNHYKKIGRRYENIFTDVPIDDEAVVEFAMDEDNENLSTDILSNETELRRMIYNYFERGSPLLPQLMRRLITKLWFQGPFVNTGFILDGYPRLPTDIEDMTACYCIPDLVMEIEGTPDNSVKRLSPNMLRTWKEQQSAAKEKARQKIDNEKKEWMNFLTKTIVVELICDEILENISSSDHAKQLSNPSVTKDEQESVPDTETNLVKTYNKFIIQFPEPVDEIEWEKTDEVRERINSRIESIYESDDENIQSLKDNLSEERIQYVSINGNKSLIKVSRLALSQLTNLRNRCESFFEKTIIISPDIAEVLILEGFCILSKFYRMCPVYIFENPHTVQNIYSISKHKSKVFPVIHRAYIYFICGEESMKKFRTNPLKYIMCNNISKFIEYPLRISVIGAPKSGKSTLAASLAKRYGLICISRGISLRNVLEGKHWTELATKMLSDITSGKCIKSEYVIKAVQTLAMDHRSLTKGFILDGFPETASEAMDLVNYGLYPNIVFDISADLANVVQTSQKEIYYDILKSIPPYSRPLIENRYRKWQSESYKIRDWIKSDFQNVYVLDGNKSRWQCLQDAVDVISDFIPKLHYYLTNVQTSIVPAHVMCISNKTFQERMSDFKNMCPLCLNKNVIKHNAYPVDKKGVVQYRKKFYWICPEHMGMVLKYPHCYLSMQVARIPEIPATVKRINKADVYENGICIVTYAEHLPAQHICEGSHEYAACFQGKTYMFCSQKCLDKFMAKPHMYYDITVFKDEKSFPPLPLKGLPNIGYLEQTLGRLLTEACCFVNVLRPKYPGLSFQLSAVLYIALHLKKHNPDIDKAALEAYQKASKTYDARCRLIMKCASYLRSMDNPFANYPKCCDAIKPLSETVEKPSSSTSSFNCFYDPSSRVPVPDERYDYLVEYHKPASRVPAFLNVVDIAGLVRGAAEGQGLGNAFLSHIKACDAIFNLCRAFDDEDVIHVDGDVNPVRDLQTIGEELRLKDEEQLMTNFEKLDRVVSRGGDKKLKPEYDSLTRIKAILVDEKKHIRFGDWSAADIEVINKYLFLTSKPALYLVNLSEKDYIRKKNKWLPKLKEWIDKNDPGAPLIPFSGVLETKLLDMEPEERKAYLKELNVTSALEKIIVQGYKALNLEYFFTAGPDEVKAWTIQKGTKAPQAAGRIHTDFEKGFIMAEVMHYKDFKEEGTEAACKSAGKYRQQGRNYVVEDGDIIFFKFNAGAGLKDAKKK